MTPVQNPAREDSWESIRLHFTHACFQTLQHFIYFVNFVKIANVYMVPEEKKSLVCEHIEP